MLYGKEVLSANIVIDLPETVKMFINLFFTKNKFIYFHNGFKHSCGVFYILFLLGGEYTSESSLNWTGFVHVHTG